jgi:hypothetical protein
MKKCIFLFSGIFCALMLNVHAQVDLYTNDFEAYTVGGKIAQQAGAPWTTWSLAPGGSEDAVISSTQAHSGTKSFYVVNSNDLVYQFNGRTSGRYMVEWYMFVENGKLGYFNFLGEFAGTNSTWALQAFVSHDSLIVDAGGQSTGLATNFTHNVWHQMQFIIDLDDDFATLYLGGTEVISYKWSLGAFGIDNVLKLGGINFYGWNNGGLGTSGYYIDDLNIDSVAAPILTSTLVATLNGSNIDVNWTASAPAPDLYKLSCNGTVVQSGTGLTYTNMHPWPDTYRYVVRARYSGQGYTHASNEDSVTIAGGITRDLVLMEGGTGLWCQYCPGAALGLHDLIEVNHKKAAAIEYHSGDSLEIPASTARKNYYSMNSLPTVVADGKFFAIGGDHSLSLYSTYLEMYNQRIVFPGHHILNVSVVENSYNNFTATIVAEQTFQAITSGIKLHTAVTESNLSINWQGQSVVDYACRGMFPDANGIDLDFSVQNPLTKTINFSIGGHVKANCELVVFIQYDALKEVTETVKVDLGAIGGTEEMTGNRLGIYPNPASEYIMALTNGKGLLEIFDMTGKLISSVVLAQCTQVIDIRGLTSGIYMIKVNNGKNTFVQKLIKE